MGFTLSTGRPLRRESVSDRSALVTDRYTLTLAGVRTGRTWLARTRVLGVTHLETAWKIRMEFAEK
jgi:hypothetical protein